MKRSELSPEEVGILEGWRKKHLPFSHLHTVPLLSWLPPLGYLGLRLIHSPPPLFLGLVTADLLLGFACLLAARIYFQMECVRAGLLESYFEFPGDVSQEYGAALVYWRKKHWLLAALHDLPSLIIALCLIYHGCLLLPVGLLLAIAWRRYRVSEAASPLFLKMGALHDSTV